MNTSKQVNVMIGLLFIGALATLLYFMWDNVRDTHATDRQIRENAERGGKLFSLNCRACHGLTGLGTAENASLPGAPLNLDSNRDANESRRAYLRETIRCGRVGTSMPPWSIEQGGPLNDFQIEQIVALITGGMAGFDPDPRASLAGWERVLEVANYDHLYGDEFTPAKHLVEAAAAGDTTFVLNNARGLKPATLLRIDDEPDDGDYEVVQVVDAPAGSVLARDAASEDAELSLQEAAIFEPGDIIMIEKELLEVLAAPAQNNLAEAVSGSDTTVALEDAAGFATGEVVKVGAEKMRIVSVSRDALTVERGYDGSTAAEHPAQSLATEAGIQDDLSEDVAAGADSIRVADGEGFASGQVIKIDNEKLRITSVSGDALGVERGVDDTRAAEHANGTSVSQQVNVIEVERGVDGTDARKHNVKKEVFEVGTEIEVQRGAFKTKAVEHDEGAHVFNGPIIPADSITGSGEGNPPCGQRPARASAGGAAEVVEVSGSVDVSMQDNLFDVGGKHNPTLKIAPGAPVTFNLTNDGAAPHNLEIAGPDGVFETEDDFVSDPELVSGGGSATLEASLESGEYSYRCKFHPADMSGKITVE